jgi:Flp pilus assembly protein TadG
MKLPDSGVQRMAMGSFCKRTRRGAALVESAIVTGVLLVILLTAMDLSRAVLENNTLSEGARRLARAAIVRGALSAPEATPWGPETFTGTADQATEIADALRPVLVEIDTRDVVIQAEWPDGGNQPGDRVRITLAYQYKSILPFTFAGGSTNLKAISTLRIQH